VVNIKQNILMARYFQELLTNIVPEEQYQNISFWTIILLLLKLQFGPMRSNSHSF